MPEDTDNRPKKPTIHELEAILAEPGDDTVVLNPDGSVSVLPKQVRLCMSHDQVWKTLCDDTTVSPTNWCVACRAYTNGYNEAEKHAAAALEEAQEQIDSLQQKVHLCTAYDKMEHELSRLVALAADTAISDAYIRGYIQQAITALLYAGNKSDE